MWQFMGDEKQQADELDQQSSRIPSDRYGLNGEVVGLEPEGTCDRFCPEVCSNNKSCSACSVFARCSLGIRSARYRVARWVVSGLGEPD